MENQIAEHVIASRFDQLDSSALAATKHHILHTLVTAVAGSNAPGIRPLHELAVETGGMGSSTVLVHGSKMTAMNAAMVNSAMAHAQDFDLNDDRTFYKSSVAAVPAALAVGEHLGGVDGKEFITSVCVGIDLGIRIGLAIMPRPAHAHAQMIGGFAAVATAGRLMKLNREQMLDALGLAYCQVNSSGSSSQSPAVTKRLSPGLAARAGIFSAQLGQKGFKATRGVLSGPKGFFQHFLGTEGDLDGLVSDLGKRWEVVNVGPKGYPCCRILHAPIDAALGVVKENGIEPEEVASVMVRGAASNIYLSTKEKRPSSFEKLRHPQGVVDAQFSIPWGVAAAIARRSVFIECFTETAIKDPLINKLTELVDLEADRTLEPEPGLLLAPVVVEIKTKRRGTFSKRVNYAKGNPKNPVTWQETVDNFHKASAYSARPLKGENIDRAVAIVHDLEKVASIANLTEPLVGEQ